LELPDSGDVCRRNGHIWGNRRADTRPCVQNVRCCRDPDRYSHGYPYAYRDGYPYAYRDGYPYTYGYRYPNPHNYCYGDGDADDDAHSHTDCDAHSHTDCDAHSHTDDDADWCAERIAPHWQTRVFRESRFVVACRRTWGSCCGRGERLAGRTAAHASPVGIIESSAREKLLHRAVATVAEA